ncbi:hypothetical protein ACLK19_23365 [Escherichia coli]
MQVPFNQMKNLTDP